MQYPYYKHEDKFRMYTIGSLFYAIYFWVSFPVFYTLDEWPRSARAPLWRAAWDALASAMLVTIILDLWRVGIGSIHEGSARVETPPPFLATPVQ